MEVAKTRLPAKSFRDLEVWQEAYKLAVGIYKLSEKLPNHERYALTSQMCRAGVSVPSNIAEGFGRRGSKEKDQFYAIANGSLTELENQILIAQGIGYFTAEETDRCMAQCTKVHKLLIRLQQANQRR